MKEIFNWIQKVASGNSPVLILGESGTGKELIAKAIHYKSNRAEKPFVDVNCSAIPEKMLESELFGHEKGAFTDAKTEKKGLCEVAEGGTIFLDEIGEMSLDLQPKILRVLQEREIRRVGGTKNIPINVRIITATNKNLEEEVQKGLFREDLYYRLNVIPITVPPLRERKSDIPLLVEHFVKKYASEMHCEIKNVEPGAMDLLMAYEWSGNVRELENTIERVVLLNKDSTIITARDLYFLPRKVAVEQEDLESWTIGKEPWEKFEKRMRNKMTQKDLCDMLYREFTKAYNELKTRGERPTKKAIAEKLCVTTRTLDRHGIKVRDMVLK